jgi:hypothetical protein
VQLNLVIDWADGSYDFRLTWAGCAEIERKSDAAIQSIYERVMLGQSHSVDVAEIIRQGLLGGSGGTVDGQAVECKPAVVEALLKRYVTGPESRPFTESWTLASTVLHTFMVGYEPQPVAGEGDAEGSKKKADETVRAAST